MRDQSNYFAGLNGIRAIAAIAVLLAHIGIALEKFGLNPLVYQNHALEKVFWNNLGSHSVTVFFVLSGFLITWLLQKEKEHHKTIDVKKFYLRRMLRIWPLYYLYLLIVVGVTLAFQEHLHFKSLLLYIFLAPNVHSVLGPRIQLLAHYWSLGVEEQFYLFWPWFNLKARSILNLALILILIFVATRLALHFIYPGSIFEKFIRITRMQCIMIGAAGAILFKRRNFFFLNLIDNKVTQAICWVILSLIAFSQFPSIRLFDAEIISIISLFIIIGQLKIKNRVINLEKPMLHFLGSISFGIYIFHPLVIFLFVKLFNHPGVDAPLKYVLVYSSIITFTVLLSYLSYNYFEKYFLALKIKFEN